MAARVLCLLVLLVTNAPLLLAQTRWQREAPLSPSVLGPAARGQSNPSVAFDGENFFVIWTHDRPQNLNLLLGARVSASGVLLDHVPIRLSETAFAQATALACNGSVCLATWRYSFFSVFGRLVDRAGQPLGSEFRITQNSLGGGPSVATNGDSFLVSGGGAPASVALVTSTGEVRSVQAAALDRFSVRAIASDGTDYLLAAEQVHPYEESRLIRVSSAGEILSMTRMPWTLPRALEWTGDSYLLMHGIEQLYAQRVTREGELVEPPIRLGDSRPTDAGLAPVNGTAVAVWAHPLAVGESGLIMTRRATPESVSHNSLGISTYSLDVAAGKGGTALLVWAGRDAIRHALIDSSGVMTGAADVTAFGYAEQRKPAAVATSDGWLTVWQEEVGDERRVRGNAGAGAFDVSPAGGWAAAPALAANSDIVFVVWYDFDRVTFTWNLFGRRFSPRGEPLDAHVIPLAQRVFVWDSLDPTRPAVTWNGRYFLVAWVANDLRVARVTPDGVVVDPAGKKMPESVRREPQMEPVIASLGDVSLLVWQDGMRQLDCQITCPVTAPPRVEAVRLDQEANVIDPVQRILRDQAAGAQVGASGGRFLVLWEQGAFIGGAILTSGGSVTDEVAFGPVSRLLPKAHIAPISGGFFVVWKADSIVGRPIDINGNVGPLETVGPASPAAPLDDPFVAVAASDRLITLFSRWTEQTGGVMRSFVRLREPAELRRRTVRR